MLKIKTQIQLCPVKCRTGTFFLQGNSMYHTKLILLNDILLVCGLVCVWFEFYRGLRNCEHKEFKYLYYLKEFMIQKFSNGWLSMWIFLFKEGEIHYQ